MALNSPWKALYVEENPKYITPASSIPEIYKTAKQQLAAALIKRTVSKEDAVKSLIT
jgi:hypothetical protein